MHMFNHAIGPMDNAYCDSIIQNVCMILKISVKTNFFT